MSSLNVLKSNSEDVEVVIVW